MKKQNLILILLMMCATLANAQLYSSGNNVIAGTNVGIGVNAPQGKLHVKGTGGLFTVIQSDANNATAGIRIQDNSGTASEFTITKFGSATTGTFMNKPRANMSAINSLYGPLVLNGGGRMIFGTSLTVAPFTQTPRFLIDSGADVYIGALTDKVAIGATTIAPVDKLHVIAGGNSHIRLTTAATLHTAVDGFQIMVSGQNASLINKENADLDLGTNDVSRMKINAAGQVVIGATTTPVGYKLFVEEGILTEKVKVAVKTGAEWSDYVFDKDYSLLPLNEVGDYIATHKHLPGVPSASEVVADGIDMAKMDATLLKKIEEMTLYMLQMNKRIEELEKENRELKSR